MFYLTRVILMSLGILIQGMVFLHGAELVRYDFSGQPGNQSSTSYESVSPHITAGVITRGLGITPAALSDSMCSTSWSASYTLDTSENDYYEFSLTPQMNYKFIIGHFIYGHQRSNFGPRKYAWRTSIDNFTQNLSYGDTSTAWQSVDASIAYNPLLSEINSQLILRDYGYYSTSSSGWYSLRDHYSKDGLVVTGVVLPTSATASKWYSSGGGSFNQSTNWKNNTVPNGVDAAALLWYFLSTDSTITVDNPVVLGTLDLDGQGKSITLAGSAGVTMQTSVDNPRIGVYSGNNIISAPLSFAGSTIVDSGPGMLTISGAIDGAGGLTKNGSGILVLSNTNNNYQGNTVVQDGTMEMTGGIGNGGTSLIYVQSGKLLFSTVNVNKPDLDITTDALTTFEVLNGTHEVGGIEGSGTLKLDSGAHITASFISMDTQFMGSGASITITHKTGGPLSGAITPVPEPGSVVLLAGALMLVALFYRRKAGGYSDCVKSQGN